MLNYYADVDTETNPIERIQMKDIDFQQFTISFRHELVEFDILKPIRYKDDIVCQDWQQVEQALIGMFRHAAAAKHCSAICFKKIVYPHSAFNLFIVFGVCLVFAARYYPELVYSDLLGKIPYISLIRPYNDYLLLTVALIHFTEAMVFLRPRLNYYRVPIDYAFEWYCCAMLDGYASVKRFNHYLDSIKDRYFDFSDDSTSIDAPVVDSDSEF